MGVQAVLMSIQPKWCELIASGKKTVEVRKTKPKLETPFKVYIYCTKDNAFAEKTLRGFDDKGNPIYYRAHKGKIIGEFVCDRMVNYTKAFFDEQETRDTDEIAELLDLTCLTYSELCHYVKLNDFYGWHISDLVIYKKPKELSEFYRECEYEKDCGSCPHLYVENTPNCYETWCEIDGKIPITRPPQSWCYAVKGD